MSAAIDRLLHRQAALYDGFLGDRDGDLLDEVQREDASLGCGLFGPLPNTIVADRIKVVVSGPGEGFDKGAWRLTLHDRNIIHHCQPCLAEQVSMVTDRFRGISLNLDVVDESVGVLSGFQQHQSNQVEVAFHGF